MAATQAAIHARTADYTFLSWNRCVCQVWHGAMSDHALKVFFKFVAVTSTAQARDLVFLIVAEEQAPPPPAPLRAELARHLRETQHRILRSAVVHEGTGFGAAVVRSFATSISVLSLLGHAHEELE